MDKFVGAKLPTIEIDGKEVHELGRGCEFEQRIKEGRGAIASMPVYVLTRRCYCRLIHTKYRTDYTEEHNSEDCHYERRGDGTLLRFCFCGKYPRH